MEALEDEPSWAGGERKAVCWRGRIASADAIVNKAAALPHTRRKRNLTTSVTSSRAMLSWITGSKGDEEVEGMNLIPPTI